MVMRPAPDTTAQPIARLASLLRARRRFWLEAALAALGAAVTLVVLHLSLLEGGLTLSVASFAVALAAIAWSAERWYPHDRFGLCNTVTLLRAAILCAILGSLAAGPDGPVWAILGLAVLALVLDGIDGFLARRSGLSSEWGAFFDMEVDAAMGLVLALHIMAAGHVGAHVLILGIMRYLFLGLFPVFPWLARPLPPSFARKAVCVLQVSALIVLLIPVLPQAGAQMIALGAIAALLWSFGRDSFWLWQRRHRPILAR